MKIALAQIKSAAGQVNTNIRQHLEACEIAIAHQVKLICFPELSLTGYEPSIAKALASTAQDERWQAFQQVSDQHDLIICAGLPLLYEQEVRIGMLILQPHQPVLTYAKQYLHEDELPFFPNGTGQLYLHCDGEMIAPAICYESLLPVHAQHAVQHGATIYLVSVAKSAEGIRKAYKYYPSLAAQHQLPVLLCNSTGPCDDFICSGESAVWNKDAECICALDQREGMLIYNTFTGEAEKIDFANT